MSKKISLFFWLHSPLSSLSGKTFLFLLSKAKPFFLSFRFKLLAMSLVKRDTFKLPAQVMNGSMMNPGNIKEEWVILSMKGSHSLEMWRTRDTHRLKFSLLSLCLRVETAKISVLKVHTSKWWLDTDMSSIYIHTSLMQEKCSCVNDISFEKKKNY